MFCLFCVAALAYLLMQWARERHDRVLFRHETFHDLDDFSLSLLKRHTAFREKREQVGLDRWAGDIKRKHRERGFFAAAASVLVDGVTLSGTARKRLIREEFELLSAIALRTDEGFRQAEENIRLCVKVTGPRLRHGIRLLRKSQRMTRSVGCANTPNVSPRVQQQATQVALHRDSFIGSSNDFVAIATSAGAGASTAIGLWGAVQLAGHASTSAAMAGLYGAAAHNAGWAWFGGGSLASGGGGMALGQVLLPGVKDVVVTDYSVGSTLVEYALLASTYVTSVARFIRYSLAAVSVTLSQVGKIKGDVTKLTTKRHTDPKHTKRGTGRSHASRAAHQGTVQEIVGNRVEGAQAIEVFVDTEREQVLVVSGRARVTISLS